MQNVFYIDADLKQKKIMNTPTVTQNDAVTFIVSVFDDGTPFPLTNVETATLVHYRSDKQSVLTTGQILTENQVKFELGTTEISVPGKVEATVQLYDNEGRVSTISFKYMVVKDLSLDYIPSENEQTLIETVLNNGPLVIQQAQDAAEYATTQGDYAKSVGDQNKTRWLNPVATFADIATTYPNPQHGDTVMTTSDGKIYRYENNQWNWTQAYTDTAIADAQNKIGILFNNKHDWVNVVEKYGNLKVAIAQGYDWTAAIQKAIDDLDLISGGTVYIPDGEYWISVTNNGGVKVKDNINIVMGAKAALKAIPCSDNWYRIINVYNRSNVVITGGKLVGERDQHTGTTGQMGFGIEISGSTNVTVYNVEATNFWGDGFCVMESAELGESKNVKIINCIAYNNRRQGLSVTGLKGGLILGNTFYNTNGHLDANPVDPSAGIDIEPNANYVCEDIIVSGNRCYSNKHGIIAYDQFSGAKLRDISIIGNNTHDNAEHGIWVNGCAGGIVSGNISKRNGTHGIHVEDSYNLTVGDNKTNKNTQSGIYLHDSGGLVVSGNHSEQNGYNGIFLNGVNNSQIGENITRQNTGNGIRLYRSSHNQIEVNTILGNTSDNVYIEQYSSYNTFKLNKVRKHLTTGTVRGISSNIITLDYNASDEDDFYNGMTIEIWASTGSGQTKTITDYDGKTRQATLDSAFTTSPTAGVSLYHIYPATKAPNGIKIADATCNKNRIKYNDLESAGETAIISDSGWQTEISANEGYVTENKGTITVGAGSTSIVVNHGLSKTPNIQDILVTPTGDLGNASKFWISNPTPTQFTINLNVAPGNSNASFVCIEMKF